MIMSKISLQVRPKTRRSGAKINCGIPQCVDRRESNMNALAITLASVVVTEKGEGAEFMWVRVSKTIWSTRLSTLGTSRKRHRDWFDENNDEVKELLKTKNKAHAAAISHSNSPYLGDSSKQDPKPNGGFGK